MDIFEHILKEHQEVNQMLEQLAGGASGKTELFNKAKTAIIAHSKAEEGSIYPAFKQIDEKFIMQSIEEHNQVADLLNLMDKKGVSDDSFSDNLSSLTNMILSHVRKEESQMIPKAHDSFDQDQVKQLSQKFDEIDNRITQKA